MSVGVFCTALHWLHLKEALSNMFLGAGVEVKEHCLPGFPWSSNTILCVGVSSSECRLCILHSLEFPAYSMVCLAGSLLSLLVVSAEQSCSYLFVVGCSLYTPPLTRWRMGAELIYKDSKMIKIMLLKGSIRSTDGEDFCCSVFSQPQVASGTTQGAGRAFQAPQHEARAPSDRPTLANIQPGLQHSPDFWGKKINISKAEHFHEWYFFSPGCCKINVSPVHSEMLCQNCWCWHMRRGLPLAEQPAEHPPCSQGLWAWGCCALKNPIWVVKHWQESIPACGSTWRKFYLLPL